MPDPRSKPVKPGRPAKLWDPKDPPFAVNKYYNTFQGETSPWCEKTYYPYEGPASALFRLAKPEEYARYNEAYNDAQFYRRLRNDPLEEPYNGPKPIFGADT